VAELSEARFTCLDQRATETRSPVTRMDIDRIELAVLALVTARPDANEPHDRPVDLCHNRRVRAPELCTALGRKRFQALTWKDVSVGGLPSLDMYLCDGLSVGSCRGTDHMGEGTLLRGQVLLDRRDFLVRTGLVLAAAGLESGLLDDDAAAAPDAGAAPGWNTVRAQFRLDRGWSHLGVFLLASHPRTVREAIDRFRRRLDARPVQTVQQEWPRYEAAVLRAVATYLGASPADIALTDSTSMGLALLYNGIDLRPGQEALATRHDFFVTRDTLRARAARVGASYREISLYDEQREQITEDQVLERLLAAVRAQTRVVALTWVHSSTGVKLPIRRIAERLRELNAGRSERDRVLLCVDGVHGFGVENVTMGDLGCDFFVAGCHKWLFGPRGTGLVWGRRDAWPFATPTIPSFTNVGTPGSASTPGGYHSFEHRWALAHGFAFQRWVGKARVQARTHALNTRFKNGLAGMSHVTLYTPRAERLSAGIVCFDVRGLPPPEVVARLRAKRIIASVSPYVPSYARISPSILNTPAEIDKALEAIRSLR
jgi:isopenicillin-N epimerase